MTWRFRGAGPQLIVTSFKVKNTSSVKRNAQWTQQKVLWEPYGCFISLSLCSQRTSIDGLHIVAGLAKTGPWKSPKAELPPARRCLHMWVLSVTTPLSSQRDFFTLKSLSYAPQQPMGHKVNLRQSFISGSIFALCNSALY
ncbi:hypothetical protein HRR81_004503 [Exophiala dermatitidis]|nr:hypothetical protein HRR73_009382 [Exophiala dermatitidis]KAJ4574599.1 hypothetical protein HRR81_004503 [Exophiala dermatitidis]KAJ4606527.1 hypothetical protein HRR85_007296 [Exophiala dermatitidis]KAJ9000352.1 hypothetical protein HRR94_004932 [Exophiala dermatitidis]